MLRSAEAGRGAAAKAGVHMKEGLTRREEASLSLGVKLQGHSHYQGSAGA